MLNQQPAKSICALPIRSAGPLAIGLDRNYLYENTFIKGENIMPMFEYNCDNCHYRFDRMVQRWDDQVKCPVCENPVHKLMSTFAIGASQKTAVNLPPDLQPKMCTNC